MVRRRIAATSVRGKSRRKYQRRGLTTQFLKLGGFICGDADGRSRGRGTAAQEGEAEESEDGNDEERKTNGELQARTTGRCDEGHKAV